MRFDFSLSLLILFLLFQSCAESDLNSNISISRNPVLSETEFKIRGDSCATALVRYDAGVNHGILKYRNKCNFKIAYDLLSLERLLQAVVNDSDTDTIHTITWGRLTPNLNQPSIFSQRLAGDTYKRSDWDQVNGKPFRGHINDYVHHLLNSSEIIRELKSCFNKIGITLRVSGVEKVIVLPANSVPGLELNSEAKLPVDCQLWFSVNKAGHK